MRCNFVSDNIINPLKINKMNKEVFMATGLTALAVIVVLVVRDNMPKGSFSFKKA